MNDEPLTDEECYEIMSLYRIVRDGDATAEETERCKELLRRWELNQRKKESKPWDASTR